MIRLVKMTFREETVETFQNLFKEVYPLISTFKGCTTLALLRGIEDNENVFYTYSTWVSKNDLENYRNSELFLNTWKRTKILFQVKAEAISLENEYPDLNIQSI